MNDSTIYRFFLALFGFILVIGPAVFVHELGHFIFAKRYGVKVFTFSLGFGPKIWSREWGGTEYRISWIPLGGYVKMSGEDPAEERHGAADEFASKPIWQRAVIIFAGPAFSILFGFVLAIWIYLAGIETAGFQSRIGYIAETSPLQGKAEAGDVVRAIDGSPVTSWFEVDRAVRRATGRPLRLALERGDSSFEVSATPVPLEYPEGVERLALLQARADDAILGNGTLGIVPWVSTAVGGVKDDGPAKKAGILPGDTILFVGGETVAQWGDIGRIVRESTGETMPVRIARGTTVLDLAVKPKKQFTQEGSGNVVGFWAIGITARMTKEPRGVGHAAVSAVFMTLRMTKLVLVTLHKLVTGNLSLKLLAGPIGIAHGSGISLREGGIEELVYFLTVITMNLGIVNLIPLPLLDGGWIFIFLMYEFFMKRPISQKNQERIMHAGFAMIIALILFITYNDLGRVLEFQTVEEVVENAEKNASKAEKK